MKNNTNKPRKQKKISPERKKLINIWQDTVMRSGLFDLPKKTVKYDCGDYKTLRRGNKAGVVKVFDNNTVDHLISAHFENPEYRFALLNMASQKRAGGGVANGARAQEESLFRCCNAHLSVTRKFYPLSVRDLLYTKDVTFFKSGQTYDMLNCPITVDMITAAAMNISHIDAKTKADKEWYDSYVKTTYHKIVAMLNIAAIQGANSVILGAWGCGVFKNDPTIMAHLFRRALFHDGMRHLFDRVDFAIINDRNSVDDNYGIFSDILI